MSNSDTKEAMGYEKQFSTDYELNLDDWDEKTRRDIASALYYREQKGFQMGMKLGSELIKKLEKDGRESDIDRALDDFAYLEKLMKEYHLK
ncbi:hypothetical protein [Megasphaera sp. DISK 18]|uniref:hypothetical protein n=1 Tax=Megasphaera sp. DISK 18 TaxID=1776081 RepID=UPI0008070585|nr:hypothetical protein [Megasphaera sp. DISK 18]OBZ32096.1 hypothetical protein A0U42_02805 [Megasphaera sp. DISK 18]